MSAWTHKVCAACYSKLYPGRDPIRLDEGRLQKPQACCLCGGTATDGVYVRGNPSDFKCKGAGGTHEEE